ncbi:hypothetical protein D5085_07060 [Ectothiorhodospiraceae bacterium BW-2]|nr:hypothetical protein D5085_07060 [Ectothiorhodospiraceae bacterium BW-2]
MSSYPPFSAALPLTVVVAALSVSGCLVPQKQPFPDGTIATIATPTLAVPAATASVPVSSLVTPVGQLRQATGCGLPGQPSQPLVSYKGPANNRCQSGSGSYSTHGCYNSVSTIPSYRSVTACAPVTAVQGVNCSAPPCAPRVTTTPMPTPAVTSPAADGCGPQSHCRPATGQYQWKSGCC